MTGRRISWLGKSPRVRMNFAFSDLSSKSHSDKVSAPRLPVQLIIVERSSKSASDSTEAISFWKAALNKFDDLTVFEGFLQLD